MALNFDPSAYLAAFQYGQNRTDRANQQYGQGMQNVGQGIADLAQIPAQQREQRLKELSLYDPSLTAEANQARLQYYKTGQMPGQNQSSSTTPTQPGQPYAQSGMDYSQILANMTPSYAPAQKGTPYVPGQNQFASAGVSDTGNSMPKTTSPDIPQSNSYTGQVGGQKPLTSSFAPSSGSLVDRSPWKMASASTDQTSQTQSSPNQPTGMSALFAKKPMDVGAAIDSMAKGDYSQWQNLPPAIQKMAESDPRYKQLVKPNKSDLRTPEQVHALFPHLDVTELAKQYPQGIPKEDLGFLASSMKLDQSVGTKEDQQFQKRIKQLGDDLDPSKQRQGAFGVSKQIFDRAERLESLASALPDGNLDRRQIEELAIGLNAMLSGSNTGAQEQVRNLVPQSIWGNVAKLTEFLSNNPTGTQQQEFVKRMLGSIQREKQTAESQLNRTRFSRISKYSDLEKSHPGEFEDVLRSNGIDPDQYHQWKKGGYKPISAVAQLGDMNGAQSGNDLQSAAQAELARRRAAKGGR